MRLLMLFGFMALLVAAAILVPSMAQEKKDAGKEVKKDDEKKDTPKKDDPKDEKPSKKSAKDDKPPEEKLEYGQIVPGKIKAIDPDSAKDITLEIQVPDAKKIYDFKVWQAQQSNQLRQGKPNPQAIATYNKELIRKQGELTSPKDFPIRAADNIKVRTAFIPLEYDDKGFVKKFTAKELAALKGNSKLPGYPADVDAIKVNQIVQVYLAKTAAPPPASKGSKATKKADDDVELTARPEVVLIVIVAAATSP